MNVEVLTRCVFSIKRSYSSRLVLKILCRFNWLLFVLEMRKLILLSVKIWNDLVGCGKFCGNVFCKLIVVVGLFVGVGVGVTDKFGKFFGLWYILFWLILSLCLRLLLLNLFFMKDKYFVECEIGGIFMLLGMWLFKFDGYWGSRFGLSISSRTNLFDDDVDMLNFDFIIVFCYIIELLNLLFMLMFIFFLLLLLLFSLSFWSISIYIVFFFESL